MIGQILAIVFGVAFLALSAANSAGVAPDYGYIVSAVLFPLTLLSLYASR